MLISPRPTAITSARFCNRAACCWADRHTAASAAPALSHPRVSPTWRIRHRSAIIREIPPPDRENLMGIDQRVVDRDFVSAPGR